ncbi:MAG: hypothetical protein OXC40_05360 [Proteobacteria bacterium]|nr:hypothetical protein [Pseudomonadota bacterium]
MTKVNPHHVPLKLLGDAMTIGITLWFYLLFMGGCQSRENTALLEVQVEDQFGQPIRDAEIKLASKLLGVTNESGIFAGEIGMTGERNKTIQVSKHSKEFSLSPYYGSVSSQDLDRSINGQKKWTHKATLYKIPRYHNQPATITATTDQPTTLEPSEPNKETTPPESSALPSQSESAKPTPLTKNAASSHQLKVSEQNKPPIITSQNSLPKPVKDVSQSPALFHNNQQPSKQTTHFDTLEKLTLNLEAQAQLPGQITFSVFEQSKTKLTAISGATLFIGYQRSLHLFCRTSSVGMCGMKPPKHKNRLITVIVTKDGYQSQSYKISLAHKKHHVFILQQGRSLDVFALTSHYGSSFGLADTAISSGGKVLGKTSSFGYFSIPLSDLPIDEIAIGAPELVPDKKIVTINKNRSNLFVTYFQKRSPERIRAAFLPAEYLGVNPKTQVPLQSLIQNNQKRFMNHVFRTNIMRRVDYDQATTALGVNTNFIDSIAHSWQEQELTTWVDALFSFYYYPHNQGWHNPHRIKVILEAKVNHSLHGVMKSTTRLLELPINNTTFDQEVRTITNLLISSLPYQGTILSIDNRDITINLGRRHHQGLVPQTKAQVYRTVYHPNAASLSRQVITGEIMMTEVSDNETQARLLTNDGANKPRVGDQLIINPNRHNKFIATDLLVYTGQDNAPLAAVNIYHNQSRVGFTNNDGKVMIQQEYLNIPKTYTLQKPSYEVKKFQLTLKRSESQGFPYNPKLSPQTVTLERTHSFVRLHSHPTGLKTYIDGELVGTTPVMITLPPRPEVSVVIVPPKGYKKFFRTYQMKGGILHLAGSRKIRLERDHLGLYLSLLKSGNNTKALEVLRSVPPEHTDYPQSLALLAKHESKQNKEQSVIYALTLFINLHHRPSQVSEPLVNSLFNAGLLSFQLADAYDNQKDFYRSRILYERARDFLEFSTTKNTLLQKSLIKGKYYLALSVHRIAVINKNSSLLKLALERWNRYLSYHDTIQATDRDQNQFWQNKARYYAQEARNELKKSRF